MPRAHSDDALRPIRIETSFLETRPGSVLYSSGQTRVLCTASLEVGVPPFLEGTGRGWSTAEYNLLPGSTSPRKSRERTKLSGRTQEIQRLIGRSLRGVLDLTALDGYTLILDCDVLQADGGTRTASINGAYVAAALVLRSAMAEGRLSRSPLRTAVGAVSVGILDGRYLLDLDYAEDSRADVDLNLVLTAEEEILEIQGTSEGQPFSRAALARLVELAGRGIDTIITTCTKVLEEAGTG